MTDAVTRRASRGAYAAAWATLVAACALAAPAAAGDPAAGRSKARACAVCHGEDGISVQPNVPNLAGQPEPYLGDQLRQYRGGKRVHEIMSVMAKPLSDREIDDLAAWYASIRLEAQVPK